MVRELPVRSSKLLELLAGWDEGRRRKKKQEERSIGKYDGGRRKDKEKEEK